MSKEYVIWGTPPGGEDTILSTRATSMEEAQKLIGIFSKPPYGATKMRVQVIDLSEPFDAGAAFAGAIGKGRGRRRSREVSDTDLQSELERMGVEFYDGMPTVNVKVRFDPAGPKTRKALAKVDDPSFHVQIMEDAWERTQADWWRDWEAGSPSDIALKKIFGKQARGIPAGRSSGHFVVEGAGAGDFSDDDGQIDEAKVLAWTDLASEIEESVKRPALDEALAQNVETVWEEIGP